MGLFKKKKKQPVLKPNNDLKTIELPIGLEKKRTVIQKRTITRSETLSVTDNGSETIDK